MNLITIEGEFWILNTDGKIPLIDGGPHAKYNSGPTPEQSESSVDIA